jgi:hypothetical protein
VASATSTSSDIQLPGLNIAKGSVRVTAGSTPLTEGVDYTVNYDQGRISIINQGAFASGRQIVINYEKADLFRIGKLLGISPSNDSFIGDSTEIIKRQNRMRASVSRLLNKGDKLIANCEIGIFPSFKSVPSVDTMRFTKRQLRRHEELENEWWKLDLTSTLSSGKIDKAKRVHYEESERSVDSSKTQKRERVVIIRDV